MIRVVLTMIVKNEERTLARCLEAVTPALDGYVIVDTGSTDATLAVLEEHTAGLPGCVLTHEWKNFGHNRTESADAARRWIDEQGWDPRQTYLLFLDADMVFAGARELRSHAAELELPAYRLLQKSNTLAYPNLRLARSDLAWRAVGVTHEYWTAGSVESALLDYCHIDDRGDGGSKSDKFMRDRALLEEGLAEDPTNVRYMFYLGQTLYDLGEFEQARRWYEKRWHAGGWAEERWFARYKWGLCLLLLGDPAASDMLLCAFEERPSRAEPLYRLAKHYRELGKNHIAMVLIERARKIPEPSEGLFVERGVYGALMREEVAVSAYYTGKRDLGRDECEWLIRQRGQPPEFYEHIARNAAHYAEPLVAVRSGKFSVPRELLAGYSSSSPTVVDHAGARYVNVRLVNYDHARGVRFDSRDQDKVVRTRGVMARWEGDELVYRDVKEPVTDTWEKARVLGLEDQRWASHRDRIWFTANTWQMPGRPRAQMVLGLINEERGYVERVSGIRYAHARGVEKNWLPWARDDELFVVYEYDPLTILHLDVDGALATIACKQPAPWAAHRLRGSAGPVRHPYKSGHWIVMVHEVAAFPSERVYMQRLIEIDPFLRPTVLSRPFYLDHRGVEYPLGLLAESDALLVTYGREERESCWAAYDWGSVLSLLE